MKAKSPSSLQKIYDQAYLLSSTAVYYESLSQPQPALETWRKLLQHLPSSQSQQRPGNEIEEALRKLKTQAEDRINLLTAIVHSAGASRPECPPMSPPVIMERPPMAGAVLSPGLVGGGGGGAGTTSPRGIRRTPSPPDTRRLGNGVFLSTLRGAKKGGKRESGVFESFRRGNPAGDAGTLSLRRGGGGGAEAAAAQAATLAWNSISRARGEAVSRRPEMVRATTEGETLPGVKVRPNGGRMKSRPHSSILPMGSPTFDDTPPPPPPPPHRRKPLLRRESYESDAPPPLPPKIRAEGGERAHSAPSGGRYSDTSPTPASADSEEDKWQARLQKAIKSVARNVDPTALQQVANEIVVKGDEVHWDDIAGLEGAKAALKEAVVYPFLRPDLFSGLREPAKGMLLFGPPGTGKTMLARAVATESRSTFFSISASSLTSKYLGESEKLVRALFALAKALAPSIIFVDEIDSILSARAGGEHEATRRIKTEFLIQWSDLARAAAGKSPAPATPTMGDPSRVLVLAATNLPWAIDEAARRRFARRQYIPLPEAPTRRKQLGNLLRQQKHAIGESEMEWLVQRTEGYSGSDITALAKDAAMGPLRALGDGLLQVQLECVRDIEAADFEESLKAVRPSVSSEGLRRFEEWAERFGERV